MSQGQPAHGSGISQLDRVLENLEFVEPLEKLLISQYSDSTRVRAILKSIFTTAEREFILPLLELDKMLNMDLAKGKWLDFIGERLAFPRPEINKGEYMGWKVETGWPVGVNPKSSPGSGQNLGLGTLDIAAKQSMTDPPGGPLATLNPSGTGFPSEPMGDQGYRLMLRGRALVLRSNGGMADLKKILDTYFTSWTLMCSPDTPMVVTISGANNLISGFSTQVIIHNKLLIPQTTGIQYIIQESV